jgi:hypothetical protein
MIKSRLLNSRLCLLLGVFLAHLSSAPETSVAASALSEDNNDPAPGFTFKVYDNAVLAGAPSLSGISPSAELSLQRTSETSSGPASCYLSGELYGSISIPQDGHYRFECQFSNTSTGFVWLDGHLVCRDENAYAPRDTLDNPLPIQGARKYPFRAHIMSNDTFCTRIGGLKVQVGKALSESKKGKVSSSRDFSFHETYRSKLLALSQESNGSRDGIAVNPELPLAEQKRDELQKNLGQGWGPWLRHNILSLVKLPEGIVITPQLCQISTGTCFESATPESNGIRVGLHTYNRSYVSYYMAHKSANVSIEYSVAGNQLQYLITPVDCPKTDCGDYEIHISARYAWYRPGVVSFPPSGRQISFQTPGFDAMTVNVAPTYGMRNEEPCHSSYLKPSEIRIGRRNLRPWTMPFMRIFIWNPGEPAGFTAGMPAKTTTSEIMDAIRIQREAEEQRLKSRFGRKAAVAEAIQSAIAWTLIYNPVENSAPFLPVSRSKNWDFAQKSGATAADWTYSIFGRCSL